MTDEERQDEEQPQEEQPDAEAEQPAAEAEQPAAEQPDENPEAPGREAEEASGSDSEQPAAPEEPQAEADEAPAEEAPQAEQPAETPDAPGREAEEAAGSDSEAKESAKAKDVPPGAELEPIKIEPQRELSAEERARLEAEEEERARARGRGDRRHRRGAGPHSGGGGRPGRRCPHPGDRQAQDLDRACRPARRERQFQINKRTLEDYFPRHQHQTFVRQPLLTSGYEGKVDVRVRVHGGGIAGQAGAVRHGIARALTEIDPELRGELKRRGLLTRDARAKERRKAGLKKARKRPQFSKR